MMAGDSLSSLIQVIEANTKSTSSMQQAFKWSLAQEPAAPTLEQMCRITPEDKALEACKRKLICRQTEAAQDSD